MSAEQTVNMLDALARVVTMDVIHAIPTGIIYAACYFIAAVALHWLERR